MITEQIIWDNLKIIGEEPSSSISNYHEKNEQRDHSPSKCSLLVPKELNLSFQRLDRIENLMNGFGRITTLLLNNNKIEEICSLEDLVHLEKLDMSFNNIRAIKGLDTLTRLTHLSLFHNKITVVEGLSQCLNLQSISLGANAITSLGQQNVGDRDADGRTPKSNYSRGIMHMKELVYLKDCNLAGNPITSEDGYRENILTHLPQLEYLDNVRVAKREANVSFQTRTKPVEEKKEKVLDPCLNTAQECNITPTATNSNGECSEGTCSSRQHQYNDLSIIACELQSNIHEQENMKTELKNAIEHVCHELHQLNQQIHIMSSGIDIVLQRLKNHCDLVGHEHLEEVEQMYDDVKHTSTTSCSESEIQSQKTCEKAALVDGMMKAELRLPAKMESILGKGARDAKCIMEKLFDLEADGEDSSPLTSAEIIPQKCPKLCRLVKIIQEEGVVAGGEHVDLTYYAKLEDRVIHALHRVKQTNTDLIHSQVESLKEETLRRHRQRVGEISNIIDSAPRDLSMKMHDGPKT